MSELKSHISDKPLNSFGNPSAVPMSFSSVYTPVTDKLIFGYLPYWENRTDYLRYTLLTDILYFSCELSANGTLGECHGWPESAPIDEAHKYGVRMHLVITGFDTEIVKSLIEDETQKTAFFKNCWNQVNNAGADGINIDFEGLKEITSAVLIDFFNDLGGYFHSRNSEMIVSAAIPAVDWSGYWNLSAMTGVDYFFAMLYDYHWKGGDPGPVAPLYSADPWPANGICVEKSVNTYISKNGESIKSKLIAGYPYYGVKWASTDGDFPGTQSAKGVSVLFDTVLSEYSTVSSDWDDGSETPYKIWTDESQWYQLWYDDGESLGLKFAFANENNLAGSGMWALNYDKSTEEIWKKIAENFVADRTGSLQHPIIIDSFPFTHSDDTYRYASDLFDSYQCSENTFDTSGINESGPEIIYKFEALCKGTLTASITTGSGSDDSREDIDIHILSDQTENPCLIRNDADILITLEKGVYFASLDSFVAENITKGGPFTVTFNFSECPESENNDDDDTISGDDDVYYDSDEVTTDEDNETGNYDADSDGDYSDNENPADDSDPDADAAVSKNSGGCNINEI